MNKNSFISSFLTVLIIAVLTSACGGGSEPDANGGDPPSSGILNADLSGLLFFTEDDEAWIMSMATGKYTRISSTNWPYQKERFPRGGLSSFHALPIDYDGSEFVVAVKDCKDDPERSCIVIQDKNGSYNSEQFEVFGKISKATLSHDRQYIALFRRSISTDSQLEVRDRSGELISYSKLDRRDFAWLPDGRITYGVGRSFYFTSSYSTQVESILTLPGGLQGVVRQVAVSPDATRLFFTLEGPRKGGSFEYIRPYVMNIDGANIRQLATTPDNAPLVGDASTWSPDGQWILLREGGAASTGSVNPGFNGYFYVVPTEDTGQIFTLSSISTERSSEVRLLRRYSFSDNPANLDGSVTDRSFANDISWLP
ncbi:MAG: hypothetical protein L3K24_12770 [Gammaproteobacteria bacterium]|nr:hypothetical protein [Gammaproteobacteria bacterium]